MFVPGGSNISIYLEQGKRNRRSTLFLTEQVIVKHCNFLVQKVKLNVFWMIIQLDFLNYDVSIMHNTALYCHKNSLHTIFTWEAMHKHTRSIIITRTQELYSKWFMSLSAWTCENWDTFSWTDYLLVHNSAHHAIANMWLVLWLWLELLWLHW